MAAYSLLIHKLFMLPKMYIMQPKLDPTRKVIK